MLDFKLTPVSHAIGCVYGLWTETPQAVSRWVLNRIRRDKLQDLKGVYEESWDKRILKIKGDNNAS